jgi:hydroxymethylpyrimidine/phosphomethylpyrimidine kinase
MIANVLSIAGSDPGGGAGIQADLKTFAALHCHGLTAITALTVQNSRGVFDVHLVSPDFVAAEIAALFDDCEIAAVKIGMLGSAAIASVVGDVLARRQPPFIVLDPVRAASTGANWALDGLADALIEHLARVANLVTPNLAEAAWLSGMPTPTSLDEMEAAAKELHRRGFHSVLVKGGHLDTANSDDVYSDGTVAKIFAGRRIATRNTHGTGCTLSSAIAAYVARGLAPVEAIEAAKLFVARALEASDRLNVGTGPGPLHHFHKFW